MGFRKELDEAIKGKLLEATEGAILKGVSPEEANSAVRRTCGMVALDGFLRGALPDGLYEGFILASVVSGRGSPEGPLVETILRCCQLPLGSSSTSPWAKAEFFSSRPSSLPFSLGFQPMSRRKAEEIAKGLKTGEVFAVFLFGRLRTPKGRGNHVLSLIGSEEGEGRILRVDGAASRGSLVTCLTPREAANLMRRAQRQSFVISVC